MLELAIGFAIGMLVCYWAFSGKIVHTPLPTTTRAVITEYTGDKPAQETTYFKHEGDTFPVVSFKTRVNANGSLSYSALYRA